jgi:hypothetical protein
LTPQVKGRIVPKELEQVRRAYADRLLQSKRPRIEPAAKDGTNDPAEEGVPADKPHAPAEPAPGRA